MTRKTWVVVIVLVLVIGFAIALGAGFYLLFRKPVEVRTGTVLELKVENILNELPPENPIAQVFGPDLNLWEVGEAIQAAKADERVAGIYLEIHPLLLSWGQIEELRDYLRDFRQSAKPIHALLAVDMVGEAELYLAAVADSITLNPDAGWLVNGLAAEVTFYKRTLEKLRVRPQFLQFKEYKSPESFTREKLSPEVREMLESVLSDMQKRFIQTVAKERKIDEAALERVMTLGLGPADVALREKMVDALGYKDEIEDRFVSKAKGEKKYHSISVSRYSEAGKKRARGARHKVALIGGMGAILAGHSDPFAEMMGGATVASRLREIRNDRHIKGVIFRVDSPGGSAVGSDMIWREIRLLEKANKPVVVSMSGVAGSGGYYISMGARRIVSQPSTITGSIGVIFGKFDMTGLYDWLGMNVDRVKLAPNSDIFSAFTSLSEEQKKQVETWMHVIYENFVRKAAEGRKTTYEQLEPKAHGRIYTGSQAKALGLVDELGGLSVAVAQMKKALSLKEDEQIELVLFPKPKSLWQVLTSGEFFGVRQPPSLAKWLEQEIATLTRPAAWLLAPQIKVY